MTNAKPTAPPYILGHAPDELERLIRQSSYYNQPTKQVLLQAGLRTGMTVLDVGCGAGDVAFLAAELVGPEGNIVAIDQSPDALAFARYRAEALGLHNITFVQSDLNEYAPDAPVDAVIGRLVLLYQRDPVASLVHLKRFLKPGGIVAFQEFNMAAAGSWPRHDFFDRHLRIIIETFERAGMDPLLGVRLFFHLREAGFSALQSAAYTSYAVGENVIPAGEYLAHSINSVLPAARQMGVSIPDDLDLGELPERLRQESERLRISFATPVMVGVWGVKA